MPKSVMIARHTKSSHIAIDVEVDSGPILTALRREYQYDLGLSRIQRHCKVETRHTGFQTAPDDPVSEAPLTGYAVAIRGEGSGCC